jgi:hypothetical protein
MFQSILLNPLKVIGDPMRKVVNQESRQGERVEGG